MKKQNYSLLGAGALSGAAFIYAIFGVFAREMAHMWGDNAQVAARLIAALVLLTAYLYFKKHKARIPKGKMLEVVALGIAFSLVILFYTYSVQETTLSNAVFVLFGASLVSSFLLGTLWLRETVTPQKVGAILLALVGLAFYSQALFTLSAGIVWALLGGGFDGVSNALRKRLGTIDRSAVLRLQFMVGAALAIIVSLVSREVLVRQISPGGIILTIVYALCLIGIGNLLLYGFQHFDVNVGTVILSSELVIILILGYIFYREVPAPHELLGGFFILTASVLSSVGPRMFRRN